ncbi:hypothetical protein Clacol_008500 [Clathrus columnatus]|uniref:Uncharacterized protein n=1 Tax=Clathrus columnatus TaxID=1419009 RepID=A0AAV5AHX6_9AGAM|nr:hypothetical protein Clacol_008500 [Clathrus columnatus]
MIYKAWHVYKEDKPGRLLGVILRDGYQSSMGVTDSQIELEITQVLGPAPEPRTTSVSPPLAFTSYRNKLVLYI